jgi:transposase
VRALEFSLLNFVEEIRENGINPIFMPLTWLEENWVESLEDYSSDLNPIGYVWVHLKKLYHYFYSNLADNTGSPEALKPIMRYALVHCRGLLPDSLFEILVQGISKRIETVIKTMGWYT